MTLATQMVYDQRLCGVGLFSRAACYAVASTSTFTVDPVAGSGA
jgi:hypothetical protein